MISLPDHWIWDSWYVFDGNVHHAFFLKAPKVLGDAELRHRNPSVGHAVSSDLSSWEHLPDALAPSLEPAFDSWTTWTGSVIKDQHGTWWMFYTGSSREDTGDEQRIGVARSNDLNIWQKYSKEAVLEIDSTRYEALNYELWHDQAWRDPWVYRDGNKWKMLITARANSGEKYHRGVAATASSDDLVHWNVGDSITESNPGFGQLEVLQLVESDGLFTLLWSCGTKELSTTLREKHTRGGIFSTTATSAEGPFDLSAAVRFPHDELYAARVVEHNDKNYLLGFIDGPRDNFPGYICDPIPVSLGSDGISPS